MSNQMSNCSAYLELLEYVKITVIYWIKMYEIKQTTWILLDIDIFDIRY